MRSDDGAHTSADHHNDGHTPYGTTCRSCRWLDAGQVELELAPSNQASAQEACTSPHKSTMAPYQSARPAVASRLNAP